MQERVQRFGGNLAAMVVPNIGAFIAWGLITALFIPTGWIPNETLAKLVGPIITYLLPILIGYTGGRLVHGDRGAVIGAIATAGVVVGFEMLVANFSLGILGAVLAILGLLAIGPVVDGLSTFLRSVVEGTVK